MSLPIPDLSERLEALVDIQSQFNVFSNLLLRTAEKSEIDWVNECYEQVEFVHSNFDNEIIAIAEYKGETAGIGRLVRIDEQNLELGGMYVFESFRNKGIAKEVVKFLLTLVKPSQTVYCIPFEHLLPFYQQYGFKKCIQLESVPSKILDKYHWCLKKYPEPTALLILKQ